MYSFHAWILIISIVSLAFTASLFYRWYLDSRTQILALEKSNRELFRARAQQAVPQPKATMSEDERAELERKIRAEYENQNATVARELSELRDLEETIRRVQKLPPKIKSYGPYMSVGGASAAGADNGKGGPLDSLSSSASSGSDTMSPPHLIYGMARPGADLIVQEINLRTESLQELTNAMAAKQDRVERTPMGWPILARREMSSSFGYRRDPFSYRLSFHSGLDLRAPYGTSIRATARGVVTFSGYDGEYGNAVHVDHGGGIETWYAHMSERLVRVGEEVSRGDILGRVGSTGRSTGNHVHYEVRVGGRPVDPENYIGN